MNYLIKPGGVLTGDIAVSGDKSITHRAVILAALAQGNTFIKGFLPSEDCLATCHALQQMGVEIDQPAQDQLLVKGKGMQGLVEPNQPLHLGNSGTAMRLLTGVLAGQRMHATLIGDVSLSKRPMRRVTDPLNQMGANVHAAVNDRPPIVIAPSHGLRGMQYVMPIASAQVKTSLLFAGMFAEGETTIEEPVKTRDHTERLLPVFGYPLQIDGLTVSIHGGGELYGAHVVVPADISSAAFFIVGALITHSEITLLNVGINPTRTGIIDVLIRMGADITINKHRASTSHEPTADIVVRPSKLSGIVVPDELVATMIDEFPVLFIAAACAEGETVIRGATELRVKECDRIAVMVDGLQRLGIEAQGLTDGAIIRGGTLQGGRIASCGDHRVAMSFAIAGMVATGSIVIEDCANVSTSFPNFVTLAGKHGMYIEEC